MSNLKAADRDKFLKRCGSGYNSLFVRSDGSIDVGFRLNQRPFGDLIF